MKNKKIVVSISVLVLFLIGMYCLPYIEPITVKGIFSDYNYTVYGDYVEIEEYTGKDNKVKIPNYLWGKKVKIIGKKAFYENRYIEYIICSKYIEQISPAAFMDCKYLKGITIKNNVKVIGMYAFSGCDRLCVVDMQDGLEEIGGNAFSDTKELKKIYIPETVRKIGRYAFYNSGLKDVIFDFNPSKEYIPKIGAFAFHKTKWMELQEDFVIVYGGYVGDVGDMVLINYQGNEKEVCIPSGVKSLSGSFAGNENIDKVYIPDTVTHIGIGTFEDCKNLTVYVPESVIVIEYNSEYEGNYFSENITIVTTAGSYAESFAKENGMKCEIVEKIEYPTE